MGAKEADLPSKLEHNLAVVEGFRYRAIGIGSSWRGNGAVHVDMDGRNEIVSFGFCTFDYPRSRNLTKLSFYPRDTINSRSCRV